MRKNPPVEYETFDEVLRRAASPVQASDCHGLLCGLICATGFADPRLWLPQVFDDFNPRDAQQSEALRLARALSEETVARLNSPDLDFELLLPDAGCPLRERTESLGDWCCGFLSGLGLGGLPGEAELPQEVGELMEDVAEIARVDFELDQPGEDDRVAFEEVVEYIRVGTLLIHEELQPVKPPQRLS